MGRYHAAVLEDDLQHPPGAARQPRAVAEPAHLIPADGTLGAVRPPGVLDVDAALVHTQCRAVPAGYRHGWSRRPYADGGTAAVAFPRVRGRLRPTFQAFHLHLGVP